jgi:hypothetical protein
MKFYFLSRRLLEEDEPRWAQSEMKEQINGLYESDFIDGLSLADRDMELPIRVDITSKNRNVPGMFYFPFTLRDDLIADILEFGVNNLELYDAILVDEARNQTWDDFKVCNIIGLLDIFDLQKSELHENSPSDGPYLFNEIAINQNKSVGHHIFRPFGRQSQVMVSEALKNHLESKGKYDFLSFIPPEDFA